MPADAIVVWVRVNNKRTADDFVEFCVYDDVLLRTLSIRVGIYVSKITLVAVWPQRTTVGRHTAGVVVLTCGRASV